MGHRLGMWVTGYELSTRCVAQQLPTLATFLKDYLLARYITVTFNQAQEQYHTILMLYEMLHSFAHLVVSCRIMLYEVSP